MRLAANNQAQTAWSQLNGLTRLQDKRDVIGQEQAYEAELTIVYLPGHIL